MSNSKIPTEPGWWWRRDAFGSTRCVKVYTWRKSLGWDDGGDGMDVTDDGRWLAPVASPEEVSTLIAERDAALAEVERLKQSLATFTQEVHNIGKGEL